MGKKQTGSLQIRMFEEEIEQLKKAYPEVEDMYDSNKGKLNIKKSKTGSLLYDYEIVPGSTYALDQKAQQENLINLIGLVGNPETYQFMQQALIQEGKELKLGELLSRIISNSGIQNWDKIIVEKSPQDIIDDSNMKFQIALSQAGGVTNIPEQPQEGMEQPIDYGQTGIETQQPL